MISEKIKIERFPRHVVVGNSWVSQEDLKKNFKDDFMMNGHINSLLSNKIIEVEYQNGVLGYRGLKSKSLNLSLNELDNHPLYC